VELDIIETASRWHEPLYRQILPFLASSSKQLPRPSPQKRSCSSSI